MSKLDLKGSESKGSESKVSESKVSESKVSESKVSESKTQEAKSAVTEDARCEAAGRFAYDGLDRVIHERARLSVLTSLVAHPKGLVFGDLKQLCCLTDGNLSRHLAVLEEARFIAIEKGYSESRPQTVCRITPQGRRRYLEYLKVLEQVVQDAASAARAGPSRGATASLGGRRLKLA